MRRARQKSPNPAFYHVMTRVAGSPRYFPLHFRQATQQLLETIQFYVRAYRCCLASYKIMGNHYHLILFFENFRPLPQQELQQRARLLYGKRTQLKTAQWSSQDWRKFNRKLFDISALMQHINGEYAKWFNRHFNRRGHLWADRFKNPELLDPKALQECLFYIELNAVRAGLVRRPEQWKASSAWLRWKGQDQNLIPLPEIFPDVEPEQIQAFYRAELHRRAGLSGKPQTPEAGIFLRRLRFFTDGLAIGTQSSAQQRLDQLRAQNSYRRRKKPIAQLNGFLFTLREQRSHARI
jgi:REP element-mobilizing transposase RayT